MRKKIKHHVKRIKKELKRTIDTTLFAVSGLIIASAWKDVLEEYLTLLISPAFGKVISAIFITIICVIVIYTIKSFTK